MNSVNKGKFENSQVEGTPMYWPADMNHSTWHKYCSYPARILAEDEKQSVSRVNGSDVFLS